MPKQQVALLQTQLVPLKPINQNQKLILMGQLSCDYSRFDRGRSRKGDVRSKLGRQEGLQALRFKSFSVFRY